MHQIEKVTRTIKGKEEVVDFVFANGELTANPPEIKEVKGGYKVLRGFGFSLKVSNGRNKKPNYYALELWGNNAEHLKQLGFEGQRIVMSGRVTVSQYKSNSGEDKELHTLTVERFTCIDRKEKNEEETYTTPSIETEQASNQAEQLSAQTEQPSVEDETTANIAPTTGSQVISSKVEEVTGTKDAFDDIPF